MSVDQEDEFLAGLFKIHAEFEQRERQRASRREHPWQYDIICILKDRPAGLQMKFIYSELRSIRTPKKLNEPKEFEAVARRRIYDCRNDGLLWSPRRGHWAVVKEKAIEWLKNFLEHRRQEEQSMETS